MCGLEVRNSVLPSEDSREMKLHSKGSSMPRKSAQDGIPHEQGLGGFHNTCRIIDKKLDSGECQQKKDSNLDRESHTGDNFLLCLLVVSTLEGKYKYRKLNAVQERIEHTSFSSPRLRKAGTRDRAL